jgi:hypothetical protein
MARTKEQTKIYNKRYYENNKEKVKEQAKEYYANNKEQILETVHTYREANRDTLREKGREYYRRKPENRMLNRARSRAKKHNMDFNLDESDIAIPTHCPLLGIELYIAEGRKAVKDNSASLDRIDSAKGYVKGNVWVISHRANTIKSNSTLEEIKLLVKNWGIIHEAKKRN